MIYFNFLLLFPIVSISLLQIKESFSRAYKAYLLKFDEYTLIGAF